MDTQKQKHKAFLDKYIFIGLQDLNDGFDAPGIKYFSKTDFELVLERVETYKLGIYGIEPWPNGTFGGVKVYEEYTKEPTDSNWYKQAFNEFLAEGVLSHFSASYYIPEPILNNKL